MQLFNWFLSLSKKTKIVSLAVAGVAIIGTGVGVGIGVAANNAPPEHAHSFTETIESDATCQSNGSKTYTCKSCQYSYTEEFSLPVFSANEIYEGNKNAIGEIVTYDRHSEELAIGTGFAYSSDGKILTNYHVIDKAASAKITINGMTYVVQSILAYDKDIDLAVLKINAADLPETKICTKEHPVGSEVYAIGSSKGLTGTFSSGIITYADREIDGVRYIQHNAAISGGNSGGPLFNRYGEIIGVNTMTVVDSQNLNFAVSVKELSNLVYETPLSFSEFYEKEGNPFKRVKNYILQKGTYDAKYDRYTVTFTPTNIDAEIEYQTKGHYYPTKDVIEFVCLCADDNYAIMSFLTIDTIDGIYDWDCLDSEDGYMYGKIYASTWTVNSLLSVSKYSNISSSQQSSYREIASKLISLTVYSIAYDYQEIDVCAADFGFTQPDFNEQAS